MNVRTFLLPLIALGCSATAFSQTQLPLPASGYSLDTETETNNTPPPQISSTAVWPLPAVPPDANPATIPAPRDEWVARVQGFLDHNKGNHYDLIFDGDSITDFWQKVGKAVWMEHYAALNAVDYGIAADRIENLLWRLQEGQVDGMDPKLVVLMIGTNNTGRDSVDEIADGVKKVVSEYETRCPHAHILLLAIFPRSPQATDPIRAKIADINTKLAKLDGGRVIYRDIGIKFLGPDGTLSPEIMPDYLHPSVKGYEIWANAIQPVVDKYFPPAAVATPAPEVPVAPKASGSNGAGPVKSGTDTAPAVSGSGAVSKPASSPTHSNSAVGKS